jgi:hypothetical protein
MMTVKEGASKVYLFVYVSMKCYNSPYAAYPPRDLSRSMEEPLLDLT